MLIKKKNIYFAFKFNFHECSKKTFIKMLQSSQKIILALILGEKILNHWLIPNIILKTFITVLSHTIVYNYTQKSKITVVYSYLENY